MDYIWTPWRYQYMAQAAEGKQPECIFCDAAARKDDAETFIVHRGKKAFVILNRFPYTSGHVMPRWIGDSNFMTVTGETRVHPEDLKTTYERLSRALG